MNKPIVRTLILITMVALLLMLFAAGCSTNGTSPTTTKPGATTAKTEEPAGLIGQNVKFNPNEKVSGKLSVWFYEDGKRFIDSMFEDYKQYRPDVDLEVTYIAWGDYWTKLPVALSSGTGPDLFYFHNMYDNLMVGGGQLDAYPQDLVDNLAKDYMNVAQFDQNGKTYYIGVGGGHGVIYYNKDMWSAAGLTEADFPETWEELREIAIKLTKKEADKIVVSGFNINPGLGGAFMGEIQLLSGRFIYSADGKQVMYDNPDFKKNFMFFVDLYQKDNVCSATFPDSLQSFQDGTTAMLWMHPFFSGILRSNHPEINFGVFAMPKFEGMARNWHYNNPDVSMGINAKASKDAKALAVDLLKLFFADDKYMKAWDLAQGLAPTKNSLQGDQDMMNDPILKVIMSDYENSVYEGTGPNQLTQDMIQNLADPVLTGGVDYDTAIKAAVAKMNQTLADFDFIPVERKWSHANELK